MSMKKLETAASYGPQTGNKNKNPSNLTMITKLPLVFSPWKRQFTTYEVHFFIITSYIFPLACFQGGEGVWGPPPAVFEGSSWCRHRTRGSCTQTRCPNPLRDLPRPPYFTFSKGDFPSPNWNSFYMTQIHTVGAGAIA